MKKGLFISIFICLFFISSNINAQLKVVLNNIDDTGFAAVINPKALQYMGPGDLPLDLRVDWDNANGNGSKDLTRKVPEGMSILVVGLWNRVFNGFFGGKYSYSISVYSDGTKKFMDSDNVRDNSEGMKFFEIFIVNKDGYGNIDVQNVSGNDIPDTYYPLRSAYSAQFSGEGTREINWGGVINELSRH